MQLMNVMRGRWRGHSHTSFIMCETSKQFNYHERRHLESYETATTSSVATSRSMRTINKAPSLGFQWHRSSSREFLGGESSSQVQVVKGKVSPLYLNLSWYVQTSHLLSKMIYVICMYCIWISMVSQDMSLWNKVEFSPLEVGGDGVFS